MNKYIWVFIEKFGSVVLKTIGMIILARYLTPKDFGLFGMVSILLMISNVLIDGGMAGALIKKKAPKEIDYSTVFFFNLLLSIFLYVILVFVANKFALFYGEEELTSIIPILSLVLVIRALGITSATKLTKDLKFKSQSFIAIFSYLVSLCFSFLFIRWNYGVYTLVYMSIIEALVSLLLLKIISKSYWVLNFSFESFKELFTFGFNLTLSSIIKIIYDNIIGVIFGKVYGVLTLGYYTQANKVNSIFINTIEGVINKVSFPLLVGKINNSITEDVNVVNYMKNLIIISCCVGFFAVLILSSLSNQIIIVMFGNEWFKSIIMLKILSVSGLFLLIEVVTRIYLKSYGLTFLILKIEVIKKIVGILFLLITFFLAKDYILYSFVITTAFFAVFNMLVVSKYIKYSFINQIKDLYRVFFIFTISYLLSLWLQNLIHINSFADLIIISILLLLFYISCLLFFRVLNLRDFFDNRCK